MIDAYPLTWPDGFNRSLARSRARFGERGRGATLGRATTQLLAELERLGATDVILSSNVPLRKDGLPTADYSRRIIRDPGVAVYFVFKGAKRSIACDKWDRVEDNVRALVLTIEAMRGLDRWGASDMLDRVFRGFQALPAPTDGSTKPWWEILQCAEMSDLEFIEDNYRRLAKKSHPDQGGSAEKMALLNNAIRRAREAKGASA